jgi:preprotein translocase subunit SecB
MFRLDFDGTRWKTIQSSSFLKQLASHSPELAFPSGRILVDALVRRAGIVVVVAHFE